MTRDGWMDAGGFYGREAARLEGENRRLLVESARLRTENAELAAYMHQIMTADSAAESLRVVADIRKAESGADALARLKAGWQADEVHRTYFELDCALGLTGQHLDWLAQRENELRRQAEEVPHE